MKQTNGKISAAQRVLLDMLIEGCLRNAGAALTLMDPGILVTPSRLLIFALVAVADGLP